MLSNSFAGRKAKRRRVGTNHLLTLDKLFYSAFGY